ncbi:hypothetical protein BC629DRAFT_1485165 [Irpex lacteus]|nr:hypothetical protein BC629DRAFT_1485165 [Irpex lacteus]
MMMISPSPNMKKFSALVLTFAALSPVSLAAPAPARLAQFSKNLTRRTTSHSLLARDPEEAPPSAVTPFFTPAVFLNQNYYTQTPMVAAVPEPTPTPFNGAFMDPAAEEASLSTPSPAPTVTDTDQQWEDPTSNTPAEPTPEPTADSTATSTRGEEILSTTDSDVAELATSAANTITTSATPLMTPAPTSTLTTGHTTGLKPSITKFSTPPAVSSAVPRTGSETEHAQQSRKAAIIGTLLALGSIAALIVCVFCMRLPQVLRRRFGQKPIEDEELNDDKDVDPEKSFGNLEYQDVHLGSAQQTAPTNFNGAPVLPPNAASSPPPMNPTPANSPQNGWVHEWQAAAAAQEAQFEDVTHILTDEATFSPHESDSETSRASVAPTEEEADRKSHGAVSVAHSYATCESRYSSPSVKSAEVSIADEQSASFHSAQSRSPSPPQTPEPVTPKTPHQQPSMGSQKRPRSKTFNQGGEGSPVKKASMVSSKSFPARYSNRSSEHSGKWSVLEQESEWDIAAHYGAGRLSDRHSAGPELGIIAEGMETVEIGGRNCVLVQGVAF